MIRSLDYLVVKDETHLPPWQHAKIPHLGDECGETLKQVRANKEDHSPAASNKRARSPKPRCAETLAMATPWMPPVTIRCQPAFAAPYVRPCGFLCLSSVVDTLYSTARSSRPG
jgi:hypothetical protein